MAGEFRASDANRITREYMDSILIEELLIGSEEPSLSMNLFGETFQTPIMMPAFSHLKTFAKEQANGMLEYARAAKNLGMVNWVGMCENDEFAEIMEVGAKTVRIIKPYADRDKVYSQIEQAVKLGALAVGMDTDHIFGGDGRYDLVVGEKMIRQTASDIAGYVNAAGIPFLIKGVLSVRDAAVCAECGVKGILVSHHHGRMPFAVPPLMVLPEIAREVGKSMKIFVDCSIDTGADVYKALALGADAAAVGRAMMPGLKSDGCAGVEKYVRGMNGELAMIMAFTGAKSVEEISASVLWRDGKRMGV